MNSLYFAEDTADFVSYILILLNNFCNASILIVGKSDHVEATSYSNNVPWNEFNRVDHFCESIHKDIKVVLILSDDPVVLACELIALKKSHDVTVVAFQTSFYFSRRPIFIQSIPKSGTHLLSECLKAFGYKASVSFDLPRVTDKFSPGTYYTLQHMTDEYLADAYRNNSAFVRALSNSPIVTIIRDPRDIAVSLSHYLAKQPDYHLLAASMRRLSPDDRLTSVISGQYPLPIFINDHFRFKGTIRDLCACYQRWWLNTWTNCWLVRFEDLIGPEGGSSIVNQEETIWGLQLALHVPGTPSDYRSMLFNERSPTFRKGAIAPFLREFNETHHELFNEQDQGYIQSMGYADRWTIKRSFTVELSASSSDKVRETASQLVYELACRGAGLSRLMPTCDISPNTTMLTFHSRSKAPSTDIPNVLSFSEPEHARILDELRDRGFIEPFSQSPLSDPNIAYTGTITAGDDLFQELPPLLAPALLGYYRGYNLVKDTGRRDGLLYAFHQSLGDAAIELAGRNLQQVTEELLVVRADSLEELIQWIDMRCSSMEMLSRIQLLSTSQDDLAKRLWQRVQSLEDLWPVIDQRLHTLEGQWPLTDQRLKSLEEKWTITDQCLKELGPIYDKLTRLEAFMEKVKSLPIIRLFTRNN